MCTEKQCVCYVCYYYIISVCIIQTGTLTILPALHQCKHTLTHRLWASRRLASRRLRTCAHFQALGCRSTGASVATLTQLTNNTRIKSHSHSRTHLTRDMRMCVCVCEPTARSTQRQFVCGVGCRIRVTTVIVSSRRASVTNWCCCCCCCCVVRACA